MGGIARLMRKIIFLILILLSLPAFAQKPSGSLIARGKYFSLYGRPGLDISSLLEKLDFNFFVSPESIINRGGEDLPAVAAQTIDAVYSEVCDILDIHVYDFKGNICFVSGRAQVREAAREHRIFSFSQASFYIHETATIYISLKDLTLGMLGHEMGHAIISHYFVVPPPAKVQEVLCGYIEYNLRKKSNSLPSRR